MEVEANNLYGCAMSQKMPDGDFEWLSQNECNDIELLLNYAEAALLSSILDYSIIGRTKITK